MKSLIFGLMSLIVLQFTNGVPLRLQKRAAFYIANETACVVDNTVYSNGDPIPTDDPCEACKCRPPGFACVLKDCQAKPGCRAVRRTGHCCPDYICGCEHNGRMYRDGDEIRDSKNPCYTCHCQGSSIACAFMDCFFRVDCAPEYVQGECCPRYNNCTENRNVPFEGKNPYLIEKQPIVEETSPDSIITPGVSYVPDTTNRPNIDTTVIEIFDDETKKPEPQLNHDVVESQTEKTEDSPSIEEDNKQDISTENIEFKVTTQGTVEVEKSESSEDESNAATKVNFNHDDSISDIETPPEETPVPSEEESHSVSEPEETVKYSSEIDTQSGEEHTTVVVVETVDVEPEEPNNALETGSAASDYGKSLKFPDEDKPSNATVTEEAEVKTVSTEQPQEESKSTENNDETQKSTPEVLEIVKATTQNEKIDSGDKNLYYDSRDNLQTDSVESVSTDINTKEQTVPSTTEKIDPVFSTESENLLKSFDKLEEDTKEKVSESSIVGTKQDEQEKVKTTTVLFSTLKIDTTTSASEKVKSDDKTSDDTLSSHPDVTETSTDVL